MIFKKLVLIYWVFSSALSTCYALNYSSALTSYHNKYNRRGGGTGNYYYEMIKVEVHVNGTYTFISSSKFDIYGYLYNNSFNPANPSVNLLVADDDSAGYAQFKLVARLNVGSNYILVVTSYRDGVIGCFTISHNGSANSISYFGNATDCPTAATTIPARPICLMPQINSIKPKSESPNEAKQFSKQQFIYLRAAFTPNCSDSSSSRTEIKWEIKKLQSNFSLVRTIYGHDQTRSSTRFIQAGYLEYGTYLINITVSMLFYPTLTSSNMTYISITYSNVTANLVKFGTSIITNSYKKRLVLDPGTHSKDPDAPHFDPYDWSYTYTCQLFNMTVGEPVGVAFPMEHHPHPCFVHHSVDQRPFEYDMKKAPNSSLIILPHTLQEGVFYQFFVQMKHRRRQNFMAEGIVIVNVTNTNRERVSVACVVSTMCSSLLHYQLINPTTQIALFSESVDTCLLPCKIRWNIYWKNDSATDASARWLPYQTTNRSGNNQFFYGENTTNFTATNNLFLNNSGIKYWRFEVAYSFIDDTSTSALNFEINDPPQNGTCSIQPRNGSTSTKFNIKCRNWFDQHEIRDYSIYAWTVDESNPLMLASTDSDMIELYLPSGANQTSRLNLYVEIQDTLRAVARYGLGSVYVDADRRELLTLIDSNQSLNANGSDTNLIREKVLDSDLNIQSQRLTSLSKLLNDMNDEMIENVMHDGAVAANIAVSALDTYRATKLPPFIGNITALNDYKNELNKQAELREYFISLVDDQPDYHIDHIKLKASTLVQLTSATNQLTRNASLMASSKCLRLAEELADRATNVAYENVQLIANYISQCASNVITAINAPLQKRSYVLDIDFKRANEIPDDYNSDLEYEWTNERLFADGNDFSWSTIQNGRNRYYQRQAANIIRNQEHKMLSLISAATSIHLNIDQSMTTKSSSTSVSLKAVSSKSLPNQVAKHTDKAEIRLPNHLSITDEMENRTFLRSVLQPMAVAGQSIEDTNTQLSRSISLSLIDQDGTEMPFHLTPEEKPIEIFIPRDPDTMSTILDWEHISITNGTNQRFNYHSINLQQNPHSSISVHLEVRALDRRRSYWLFYRFNAAPQINDTLYLFDGWSSLCLKNSTDEGLHRHFIDNQQVGHHQFVVYALREMNNSEVLMICSNKSIALPSVSQFTTLTNFTSDYELRAYTSGCYYLDEDNQWRSDGLTVGPLTNYEQTQCLSTHLTTFAGGFRPLPVTINWKYAFSNADFLQNKTIYVTLISLTVFYIILIIFARHHDKKDHDKLGITFMPDNHKNDQYLYQILVFTGNRRNAGTESKVHFVLSGDDDETDVRTLADPHRKILQSGSIDGFLMAVPRSLGQLNYLHIWHDNSGQGSSASWFLKYIIVQDLQTMTKSHFICQRWFAVEEESGLIERVLPVASDAEKKNFGYILSKQAYQSISDGHLWFSIFSRPSISDFTRVQRCTCCFTLLFTAMLFDILYYKQSQDSKTTNNQYALKVGMFSLGLEEFIVGILIDILVMIPNLALTQFFRRIRVKPKITMHNRREAMIKQSSTEKKGSKLTFPWWCLYIAYTLSLLIAVISSIVIIARAIELKDQEAQRWLRSLIVSFFSSIFLTQPLRIILLIIFFSLVCRKSQEDGDEPIHEYFDNDKCRDLCTDENYLSTIQGDQGFIIRSRTYSPPLTKAEVQEARYHRLKELKMYSILRQLLIYMGFIWMIFFIGHSHHHPHGFRQVNHLRQFLLNVNHPRYDYSKIVTVDDYWLWLEKSFIENIRAQQWYSNEIPRNVTGLLHDRSNRMIGWAIIKQSRIRSELCPQLIRKKNLRHYCSHDHHIRHQEKRSFSPGWNELNQSMISQENVLIQNAFRYSSNARSYVFELRGSIKHLRGNLSVLRRSHWIDHRTRYIEIEMNLYNPNIEMFTLVVLSTRFLSMGHLIPTARIEPIDLRHTIPLLYLITSFIYLFLIIYLTVEQIYKIIDLKREYFRHIWSYLVWSIIICSLSAFVCYVWRYRKVKHVADFFNRTHGYTYISLQTIGAINDAFHSFVVCCCFFNALNLLRFTKYTRYLSIYGRAIRYAGKDLFYFSLVFSILFLAFLFLFYLLFVSQTMATSTWFYTAQMLFEMLLLKFDGKTLFTAESFIATICLTCFILFVVFVGLTMFITIMQRSFRHARQTFRYDNDLDSEMFAFIWKRFLSRLGLRKANMDEIFEEKDKRMRRKYFHPIENFPDKIDQLSEVVHQIISSKTKNK